MSRTSWRVPERGLWEPPGQRGPSRSVVRQKELDGPTLGSRTTWRHMLASPESPRGEGGGEAEGPQAMAAEVR